jgi:hypothetical protein
MSDARPKKLRRTTPAVRAQAELILRARHPERAVPTPWVREPDAETLRDIPTHTEEHGT